MKNIVTVIIAISIGALSGCSSIFNTAGSDEFACPGMPKGVSCKNPREIYDLTNKDPVGRGGKKSKGGTPTYVFATKPNEQNLAPVPVLEQATAMRVWIAPWIDKNNDLHWPGLIFTQIQPKQWHFGDNTFDGIEPPVPHLMRESAAVLPPVAQGNQPQAVPQSPTGGDNPN